MNLTRSAVIFLATFFTFNLTAQNIYTFAGGGWNSNLPATAISMMASSVVADQAGNLYITDESYNRVIKWDAATGMTHIIAGTGVSGYNGDNIAAVNAQLSLPRGTAVDSDGNIYIADYGNSRVRKIDTSGIITTVAGNGGYGFSGDGGLAINAKFYLPTSVVVDNVGNLYISDQSNYRIRKVDAVTGIITTIAGTGTSGLSGDGGLAVNAMLKKPEALSIDIHGDLYYADSEGCVVRKITLSTGIITTVAGNGISGSTGDGGAATAARLSAPGAICFDANNTLFIVCTSSPRVRMVNGTTGIISTIAGTGLSGYNGMTGLATGLQLNLPSGVAVNNNGQVFIADRYNNIIRQVNLTTLQATVAVGNGTRYYSGENGDAASSQLSVPNFVKVDQSGNIFISDSGNERIFRIDGTTKNITSVAGIGINQFGGDGGAATKAQLFSPVGVAFDSQGNLYISDGNNHRIRKVDMVSKTISTIAGNGINGHTGDNKLATTTALNYPRGIAIDAANNIYIADYSNNRIRKVNASNGFISTFAGTGTAAYNGDNIAATAAQLKSPYGMCFDSDYNLYFADNGNNRIRKINLTTGIITTVAGNGTAVFSGDGGLATNAGITAPLGVFVDKYNTLYIAEQYRIRKVQASGIITTIAGDGTLGFSGDNGLATLAKVWPNNISVDASGNILVADGGNHRIRLIEQSVVAQSITFSAIAPKVVGDASFTPNATATSQLPISYTSSNTAVALISNGQITLVGEGVATITASQIGNFNYTAAAPVEQILSVSLPPKSDQTIIFSSLETKTFGDAAFQLGASASSLLDVIYTSSDPSVVSIDGNTATILGAGMITITATQTGNASYNAAVPVDQVLMVNKAEQVITFEALSTYTSGDAPFTLTASSTSGEPVSFSTSENIISIEDNIATIIGMGSVTITAAQGGTSNYLAAASAQQTICINPPKPQIDMSIESGHFHLQSSAPEGNQWFKDGSILDGATSDALIITESGAYSVTTTIEDCQSIESDEQEVDVTILGVEEISTLVKIYPNPIQNDLFIDASGQTFKQLTIVIYDAVGRIVSKKSITIPELYHIDTSKFNRGLYVVKIQSGKNVSKFTIVK